jgi:hypothetical protein
LVKRVLRPKYGRSNLIQVWKINLNQWYYRSKNSSGMAESVLRIRSHCLLAACRGGRGQGGQPLHHRYIGPPKNSCHETSYYKTKKLKITCSGYRYSDIR